MGGLNVYAYPPKERSQSKTYTNKNISHFLVDIQKIIDLGGTLSLWDSQ